VLQSASINLWVVPTTAALGMALLWEMPQWLDVLVWLAGFVGALLGLRPLDRMLGHATDWNTWARRFGVTLVAVFSAWLVFIVGAVYMPEDFGSITWLTFGAACGVHVACAFGGGIWLGRRLGLIQLAPPEMRSKVIELANRLGQPVPQVFAVESVMANAFAVAGGKFLLTTRPLLDVMSGPELESILLHELSHLREGRLVVFSRLVGSLWLLPWMLVRPLAEVFGPLAVLLLAGWTLGILRFNRWLNLRFERQADRAAVESQAESGVYAQALLKLHEFNLLPATFERNSQTHPDLYDRLIAAGVQPEFSRPAPAKRLGWSGHLFAGAVGILVALTFLSGIH